MSLVATTVIAQVRLLLGTPNSNQGRWSDTNLLSMVDMGQKHLVQELLFPESRYVASTAQNIQEYILPDCHRIYRVYLAGSIITEVPGGIDTLEGRQIGFYDQSAQGVQTTGSGGPPNAGGVAQPNWVVQTPTAYPYISNYGPPAPLTQPSFIGAQARFYRRTGSIGITPAPSNVVSLAVDGVFTPPTLTAVGNTLVIPDYFLDSLVWYVVVMAKFADDTLPNQEQRSFAESKYQENVRQLRTTVRQYKIEDSTTLMRTDRWRYAFGRRSNGGPGSSA